MSDPNNSVASHKIQRILLLGHTGFIGGHLEKAFRRQSSNIEFTGHSISSMDLTKTDEVAVLTELFDLSTAVIMCSAIKKQLGDNLNTFSQNLKMVANVCRLLEEHPVARFIFFSSTAVYGEDVHNTNITEETPVQPTSYYGIGKYAAERLFHKVIAQQEQSSLLMVRPALVYGPRESGIFYGPSGFLKTALAGKQITLWGDGKERREFIYIDDLVNLIYQLTFYPYEGVLNIVSGQNYTFVDALDIVSSLVSTPLEVDSRPRSKQKVDHGFNNARLAKLFPDFRFTSLETALKHMFAVESQQIGRIGHQAGN